MAPVQNVGPIPDLCKPVAHYEPYMDYVLLAALSAPHFLYAFLWFLPNVWKSMFGKKSVEVFTSAGVLGKGKY